MVLSRQEILQLFEVLGNVKHKTLVIVAYTAGLRVGEVVRLRVGDIDSGRGLIHIRRAKGRKDRYVPLSTVALDHPAGALERLSVGALVFSGGLEWSGT